MHHSWWSYDKTPTPRTQENPQILLRDLVGKVLDMSWTCPWTTPLSSILLDIGIFEGQEDNFTDSVPRPASSLDFSPNKIYHMK